MYTTKDGYDHISFYSSDDISVLSHIDHLLQPSEKAFIHVED